MRRPAVGLNLLFAIIALSLTIPHVAHGQVAVQDRAVQFLGVGGTGLSANDATDGGAAFFYGAHFRKLYLNVSASYFSEAGTSSLNNEFHVGYVFFNPTSPAERKDRTMFAIAGGYYMPQEGDGSLMASLAGYSAPKSWKHITVHALAGYIFPEVGDPVLTVRGGLGYIW